MLKSVKDTNWYIGYTINLKARLEEHLRGRVEATKNRLPIKLIYYEACLSELKAIKREKYFKTGFGRKFLKLRI